MVWERPQNDPGAEWSTSSSQLTLLFTCSGAECFQKRPQKRCQFWSRIEVTKDGLEEPWIELEGRGLDPPSLWPSLGPRGASGRPLEAQED